MAIAGKGIEAQTYSLLSLLHSKKCCIALMAIIKTPIMFSLFANCTADPGFFL
jgi:hypothetical protein